jgi:hypothetical protein
VSRTLGFGDDIIIVDLRALSDIMIPGIFDGITWIRIEVIISTGAYFLS